MFRVTLVGAASESPAVNVDRGKARRRGAVSVVTVAYHSHADLLELGEWLDCPENADLQWIVVYNSMPVSQIRSEHIAVVEIVNHRNEGFAKAFNQGLAHVTSDVVVSLNPDTRPNPELLDALVASLAN